MHNFIADLNYFDCGYDDVDKNLSFKECNIPIKLIAHRGNTSDAKYKENTIEAFKNCIDKGITSIETDIRITKDNKIVMGHDSVSETTGMLLSEYEHQNELLLKEVFEVIPDNVEFIFDIKEPRPKSKIIKYLLDLCKLYNRIDKCIFCSFNEFVLADLRDYEVYNKKFIRKGLITSCMEIDFYRTKIITWNLSHIIFHKFQINDDIIELIKKHSDVDIYLYTCNTKGIYNFAIQIGSDGIISDNAESFFI